MVYLHVSQISKRAVFSPLEKALLPPTVMARPYIKWPDVLERNGGKPDRSIQGILATAHLAVPYVIVGRRFGGHIRPL